MQTVVETTDQVAKEVETLFSNDSIEMVDNDDTYQEDDGNIHLKGGKGEQSKGDWDGEEQLEGSEAEPSQGGGDDPLEIYGSETAAEGGGEEPKNEDNAYLNILVTITAIGTFPWQSSAR